MVSGLEAIGAEIEEERFPWRVELEDIHMHIEQALIDRLGDVGRKLHTGRSRNDQVGTRRGCGSATRSIASTNGCVALQRAFVGRCERDRDVILPGYTHLQRAQPVLAPHYWLAYCEKFERDRQRLADCRRRVNSCPLGSAALAGSSLPIDRQNVARRLGFETVMANSLDASSDRDFVLEPLFALSLIAAHLSTWAEEWILWSTAEFGFLKLPQQFCTGSSIMPQKVNPDMLELTRGKTARVMGNLQTLLILVKGLPLAYNRDLQEDKPPLFDGFDTVEACLELAEPLVAGAELNREAIAATAGGGISGRHDVDGVPDSPRHGPAPGPSSGGTIGRRGRWQQNVPLADLPLAEFQQLDPELDESVYEVLGAQQAVAAFVSYGSTGPEQVAEQVRRWKEKVAARADAERHRRLRGAISMTNFLNDRGAWLKERPRPALLGRLLRTWRD